MTFIKGDKCELRVLMGSDDEASTWTHWVNQGLTTKHLLTGSIPMRPIDIQAVWEKERKAGSVEFGIWTPMVLATDGKDTWKDSGILKYPEFIGTCGLYSHRDIYRSWEFRILIFRPDELGKGVGTEATRLTVDYGFKRLNAHRIWLGVNNENKAAIECYKKVGFIVEGILREELFCFGRYNDAVRMAILEQEWR